MPSLFPTPRERLRRQAADWLARKQGTMSEADRRAFERWYADPAHAEAFDRLDALYGIAGGLAGTGLGRARSGLPSRAGHRATAPYALAAGLAILLIAAAAVLLGRPALLMPRANAETLYFATKVGEIRAVTLPDGSRMTLDTKTSIRVELGQGRRQAILGEGRARFAVAPDPKRPFIVRAGPTRVTAGETTFDVALIGGAASVHLLKGDATVAPASRSPRSPIVRLGPGDTVVVSPPGEAVQRDEARPAALWPTGMLEFDRAALGDVVAEANRYSRTQIRLADPALGRLRVTGTFRAGDLDGLARSLAAAFGLRLERPSPGELVLLPDGAPARAAER